MLSTLKIVFFKAFLIWLGSANNSDQSLLKETCFQFNEIEIDFPFVSANVFLIHSITRSTNTVKHKSEFLCATLSKNIETEQSINYNFSISSKYFYLFYSELRI